MTAPAVENRPKLHFWRIARGLSCGDLAEALECSDEAVSRMGLEFGHPRRLVPGPALLERIIAFTGREVGEGDFYERRPVRSAA